MSSRQIRETHTNDRSWMGNRGRYWDGRKTGKIWLRGRGDTLDTGMRSRGRTRARKQESDSGVG